MNQQEGDLIGRWKAGDSTAFEELVRRWELPIGRFLARLVGPTHRIQDLQQEVFLRVYQSGDRLRENGAFRAWLYRVALNVARDELRRPEQPPSLSTADVVDRAAAIDEQCAQRELAGVIDKAIQELPVSLREVLVLRHYEDMSFEEMSRLLRISSSTLKSRFATALNRLRSRLKNLQALERETERDELP